MEKPPLNLSLSFSYSGGEYDIKYYIYIINDSLIIKTHSHSAVYYSHSGARVKKLNLSGIKFSHIEVIDDNLESYIFFVGDTVTYKSFYWIHRSKLGEDQYSKVKEMLSESTQKYDRSNILSYGGWSCILKVDNQIHYHDNNFSFFPDKRFDKRPPPEEITLLINYIVGLCPVRCYPGLDPKLPHSMSVEPKAAKTIAPLPRPPSSTAK